MGARSTVFCIRALGGKKTLKKFKGCFTIADTMSRKSQKAFRRAGLSVRFLVGISITSPLLLLYWGMMVLIIRKTPWLLGSHVINLDSINKDILEGKNDEGASESECKGSSNADVSKNSEDWFGACT